MKKIILNLLLACLFAPLALNANALTSENTCNFPAPEHLHLVSFGSDWIQVAWDPIQGADSYRVTTRNSNNDAVLSDFFIDQPYATIANLPDDVPLKVTVKAVDPEGCEGVGSYLDVDPLSLVFDLVLAPNDGDVPEIDCMVECSVSATQQGPPATPQFTCQIETVLEGEQTSFTPFWVEIAPPPPARGQTPPNGVNPAYQKLYLYFYPSITIQNDKVIRYAHVEPHFHTTISQWYLTENPGQLNLMHIFDLNNEGSEEVSNIRINPWGGNIQIYLAAGYTATKKDDCPYVSWYEGLMAQQTTPMMQETLTSSGIETNLFESVNPGKLANTFRIVNPVKDDLTIFFEQATELGDVVELYSINGALVARQQLPEAVSTFEYNVGNLAPGTYLVKVSQKIGAQTRLVVKQ